MIEQRCCEALFAAGRTTDAAKSLLKMVNTFDKVYVKGSFTEWVSGKFPSCLLVGHGFNHFDRPHATMSVCSWKRM